MVMLVHKLNHVFGNLVYDHVDSVVELGSLSMEALEDELSKVLSGFLISSVQRQRLAQISDVLWRSQLRDAS